VSPISQLFVLGDGDRIQSMIDKALLGGDLAQVQALSENLTSAMKDLADIVNATVGWNLVFSGGDDICLTVQLSSYREDFIRDLMHRFNLQTEGSMSFGVGTSIESAYINLRRAKSRGQGVLVSTVSV
jgi:hypothetical protein